MARKPEEWITVPEILAELDISRRTWQRWRARGVTPPCTKLPSRKIKVRVRDYENWLKSLEGANAA